MDTRAKGISGEELAVRYLKKRGYRILCRNFRTKTGEIDIIARDGKDIIFIEVKLRDTISFGYPSEAVNRIKTEHLLKTSLSYLIKYNLTESPCRFEVISILKNGKDYKIDLIPLEL